MDWIIFLLIGAVAGWLAGQIMRGGGFGVIGNIIVGILGGVLGGWLLPRLGINTGNDIFNAIISSTLGAVILLFIVSLIPGKSS